MTVDFRLSVGVTRHCKTKKLLRRLGAEGILALISLWEYAAEFRPDGDLAGMSDEDIELSVGWDDGDRSLPGTLCDVGFLDGAPGSYRLHNWAERNPWVASSSGRSDAARLSRLGRANPEAAALFKAQGRTGITAEEYRECVHPSSDTGEYDRSTNVVRTYNGRSTKKVRNGYDAQRPQERTENEAERTSFEGVLDPKTELDRGQDAEAAPVVVVVPGGGLADEPLETPDFVGASPEESAESTAVVRPLYGRSTAVVRSYNGRTTPALDLDLDLDPDLDLDSGKARNRGELLVRGEGGAGGGGAPPSAPPGPPPPDGLPAGNGKRPPFRLAFRGEDLVDMWHEMLPESPRTLAWTEAHARYLTARVRAAPGERNSLEYWRGFFELIGRCPWLVGRVPPRDGKKPFRASLLWALQPHNYDKIVSGYYCQDGGAPRASQALYADEGGIVDARRLLRDRRKASGGSRA